MFLTIPLKRFGLFLAHHDTANDKGCSFGEYNEREIAENISLKVKEILESKGITVELTRGKEDVISIADRIVLANSNDYDYYISIHVNSTEIENKGTGVEAFSNSFNTLLLNDQQSQEKASMPVPLFSISELFTWIDI